MAVKKQRAKTQTLRAIPQIFPYLHPSYRFVQQSIKHNAQYVSLNDTSQTWQNVSSDFPFNQLFERNDILNNACESEQNVKGITRFYLAFMRKAEDASIYSVDSTRRPKRQAPAFSPAVIASPA